MVKGIGVDMVDIAFDAKVLGASYLSQNMGNFLQNEL
jgi:hypothetical protein